MTTSKEDVERVREKLYAMSGYGSNDKDVALNRQQRSIIYDILELIEGLIDKQ